MSVSFSFASSVFKCEPLRRNLRTPISVISIQPFVAGHCHSYFILIHVYGNDLVPPLLVSFGSSLSLLSLSLSLPPLPCPPPFVPPGTSASSPPPGPRRPPYRARTVRSSTWPTWSSTDWRRWGYRTTYRGNRMRRHEQSTCLMICTFDYLGTTIYARNVFSWWCMRSVIL